MPQNERDCMLVSSRTTPAATVTHATRGYWFCDDNGMHDEHHNKFNVNFGVTGMMDKWYGTYQLPGQNRKR